jgi:hypothetical protein
MFEMTVEWAGLEDIPLDCLILPRMYNNIWSDIILQELARIIIFMYDTRYHLEFFNFLAKKSGMALDEDNLSKKARTFGLWSPFSDKSGVRRDQYGW